MLRGMMNSADGRGDVEGRLNRNGRLPWWGCQIAATRLAIDNRDPQRSSVGYQDYYRNPGFSYAAEKAFFSLWKTL